MDAHDSGQWLSVPDAAARLGISEQEVRRRIAHNTIRRRSQPDGAEVWVDAEQFRKPEAPQTTEPVAESEPAEEPTLFEEDPQLGLFDEVDEEDGKDEAPASSEGLMPQLLAAGMELTRNQVYDAKAQAAMARHENHRLRFQLRIAWSLAAAAVVLIGWIGFRGATSSTSNTALREELVEVREQLVELQIQQHYAGYPMAAVEDDLGQ